VNVPSSMIVRASFIGGGIALAIAVAAAQTSAPEPRSAAKSIFSEMLANAPGKRLTAVVVDYAPGGASPSHRHAGAVFAYVLQGSVRSKVSEEPERVYGVGETFFEPPGSVHAVSANASASESTRLLAIFVADDGATLTSFDK
jgi:quercetin dioxygenase-like cupin family protein